MEVWLSEDLHPIIFDTKIHTEILGLERLPSSTHVIISEKDWRRYLQVQKEFFSWQERLRKLRKEQLRVHEE